VAKRKDKYYIQVSGWGTKGGSQFREVDGTPIQIRGAEGADLFLHRPPAGGGWKISSGINGMYVAWGNTKKQAVDDASQKGKPEAIMRLLKEYMASGKPLSPRFKLSGRSEPKSTSLPAGLSIKKAKSGWEVIHTASGSRLMPFAYPEKQLATDFAIRAGQVADWTRPFKDLQAESEKLADLIRGGKKPGMFEKVLDMPTTFPDAKRKPLRDMTKAELKQLRVILHILPDGTLWIKEKGADSLERTVASWEPPNRPDRTERSRVGGFIGGELVADNAKSWLDKVAKQYDLDMDEIVSESWRGGGMRHKASPYEFTTNIVTGKVKSVDQSDTVIDKPTDLQAIHDARSPRSKSADESRYNALTIDPDDPRVEQWIKDQGRSDVRGIDTPSRKPGRAKASAIRKRTYRGKIPTQVRRLR